jgi:TP901 family phage tail tape measure protein
MSESRSVVANFISRFSTEGEQHALASGRSIDQLNQLILKSTAQISAAMQQRAASAVTAARTEQQTATQTVRQTNAAAAAQTKHAAASKQAAASTTAKTKATVADTAATTKQAASSNKAAIEEQRLAAAIARTHAAQEAAQRQEIARETAQLRSLQTMQKMVYAADAYAIKTDKATAALTRNAAATRSQQTAHAGTTATQLRSTAKETRGKGSALLGGAATMAGFGGAFATVELGRSALSYEQLMARVQANTETSREQLAKMDRQAKSLGATLGVGPKQAAEGYLELSKAGFNVQQVFEQLEPTMKLAKIGEIDLATAAHAMHDAVLPFQLSGKQTAHVADVMAVAMHRSKASIEDMGNSLSYVSAVAHSAGQDVDTTIAAFEVLGRGGLANQKAGTGLRRIINNLNKPTSSGKKAIEELGLTKAEMYRPDGKGGWASLRELPDILEAIQTRLVKLDGVSQSRVLSQMFGQTGMEAAHILLATGKHKDSGGVEMLRKLTAENKRASDGIGEASRMTNKILDNAKGNAERLGAAIEGGAVTILQRFTPKMNEFATSAAKGVRGWVTDARNLDKTEAVVTDIGSAIGSVGSALKPLVTVGGAALKLFTELPSSVRVTAVQFGVLSLAARKLGMNAGFGALTTGIRGTRSQLRALPAETAAANRAFSTTQRTAGRTSLFGATRIYSQQRGIHVNTAGQQTSVPVASSIQQQTRPAALGVSGRAYMSGRASGITGGVLAGGVMGAVTGDTVTGALSGAITGMAAGIPGVIAGGVVGGLAAGVSNWIRNQGPKTGEQLGKEIAPSLSRQITAATRQQIQTTYGDSEHRRRDLETQASTARARAQRFAQPPQARQVRGLPLPAAMASNPMAAQIATAAAEKAHQQAVTVARRQGAQIAAAMREGLLANSARRITVTDITGDIIKGIENLAPTAKLTAARSMLAWAQGLENSGRLPKGAAAQIAKEIEKVLGDLGPALARSGSAGTQSLAKGLQSPAALNAARRIITRITGYYDDLPKTAGKSADQTRDVLLTGIRQLKSKLDSENVTGKTRRLIEQDLQALISAFNALAKAAAHDTAQLNSLGVDAWERKQRQIRENLNRTIKIWENYGAVSKNALSNPFAPETVGSVPTKPPVRKKRRGGKIARYAQGGLVPIMASAGEAILTPAGDWYDISGPIIPADNIPLSVPAGSMVLTGHGQQLLQDGYPLQYALDVQRPHFATGGTVVKGRGSWFTGGTTASGVQASKTAGVAIRPGATWQTGRPYLGGIWDISAPNRRHARLRQIDLGPNQSTGRRIDITPAGITKLGYTTKNFPTDAVFTARWLGKANTSTTKSNEKVSDDLRAYSSQAAARRMYQWRLPSVTDAFSSGYEAGQTGEKDLRFIGSLLRDTLDTVRVQVTRTESSTKAKASTSSIGGSGILNWPTANHIISSGFGSRKSPGGKGSTNHDGIDIAVPSGTLVKAAARGRVLRAGPNGGYGNYIELQHRSGVNTFYGHLSKILTSTGATVNSGAKIALSGNTGTSTGPHLHFGVHKAGRTIDPRSMIGKKFARGGKVGTGGWAGAITQTAAQSKQIGQQLKSLLTAGIHSNQTVDSALRDLTSILNNVELATVTRLEGLSSSLDRVIWSTTAKGSPSGRKVTKAESALIRRSQAAASLVDAALGQRAGEHVLRASEIASSTEQAAQLQQFSYGMFGIAEDSLQGLHGTMFTATAGIDAAKRQQHELQQALKIAKNRGRQGAAQTQEIQSQITDLDQTIRDLTLQRIEAARQAVRRAAQDRVDAAQWSVDSYSADIQLLGAQQRVDGSEQTAAGILQIAQATQAQIPALQALQQSLFDQAQVAQNLGDIDGYRQAMASAKTAAIDLAGAQADAADMIRQATIKLADTQLATAQYGVDFRNADIGLLQARNRAAGAEMDPGAMRGVAWIQQGLITDLKQLEQQTIQRARTAASLGDTEGVRQFTITLKNVSTELANAIADSAELIRQAAERESDIRIQAAQFGVDQLTAKFEGFKLDQQLAGTYDHGGAARADYIRSQLLPQLRAQLEADRANVAVELRQRGAESEQYRQAVLKVLQDSNTIKQAQLDVQNEIAENTDTKRIGGTLAFSYAGETLTDQLVGNGA